MSVGIVIVSHNERLAEGVVELAEEMAQGEVKIAAAGGREDGGMGTSIEKVTAALRKVSGPDGILVLLDLGSAVMITEMAIEALTEEEKNRVVISSAPLVEGAVLAAVEAAAGSNLQEVVEAANEGVMMPKVRKE
ncbi:MAG: PTS-dependent dihydroxyacetone kinase phosphotransferase subunit DhaM [Ktedonobacteraceae bacterium]|nr:PTS-dependent dihydroxyacetone kinase phosphotransferase subunit DhaM [Ktedonobacteraceae bacterium]